VFIVVPKPLINSSNTAALRIGKDDITSSDLAKDSIVKATI